MRDFFSYLSWVNDLEGSNCSKCPSLCKNRNNIVVNRGSVNSNPDVLFIGEAPGEQEDETGQPFMGRSGKWLNKFIELNGIKSYAITNVVKCRPPKNRKPTDIEIQNCTPYLEKQIEILNPKMIICLGKTATSLFSFTNFHFKMKNMIEAENYLEGIPVRFMYHPAYYLRKGIKPEKIVKKYPLTNVIM